MTESAAAEAITPSEPDGRVLGAPTTLRFALLAVLFVALGAELSRQIADVFAGGRRDNALGCMLAAGFDPEPGSVIGSSAADLDLSGHAAYHTCLERYGPHTGWVPFAVVPALVLAAVVLYLALPWWKRRRLLAIERVDGDGRLRRDLDDLAAEAGLGGRVRFAVVPGALTAGAVVFGTRRRPVVRLNAGLLVTHRADPDRFRVIVLHELAHVRNGDIPVTYATEALWRVILAAVLLPAACAAVYELKVERYPAAWHLASVQVFLLVEEVLIVVMVYLARADVLRTREMYADLTAVRLWRVSPEELHGGRPQATRSPAGRRRAPAVLGELWRTHPSWPQRRRVLVAPDALFGTGALPMFTTGLIAAVFADQFGALFSPTGDVVEAIRALLVSGLVTSIGGTAVWRAVRYARAWNRSPPSGWTAGFWLGAGLAVGELAGEYASAGRWLLPHPEAVAILTVIVMLLMAWVAEYAGLRAGTRGGRSSVADAPIGLAPAWLVLAFALIWWSSLDLVHGWLYSDAGTLRVLQLPVDHPPPIVRVFTMIPVHPGAEFTSLWWSPALLWLLPLMRARPPGLGRIMRAGLIGGAVAGCGLLAGRIAVDSVGTLPGPSVRGAVELSWILIVITAAMVVTAVIIGASTRSHPLISALIAAGVVALTGTFVAFLQLSFGGCLGPANVMMSHRCSALLAGPVGLLRTATGHILGLVILVCLGSAAIPQAVRLPLRRWPARTITPADAPARTRLRRFVVAVVVTATVVIVAFDTVVATLPAAPRRTTALSAASVFRDIPAPSARTAKLQADAWASYGGADLIHRIETMAGKTLPNVLAKISGAGAADVDSVANRFAPPACTALIRLARDADRYFPVPVAAGRQNWADAVAALDDAARACHRFQRTREFDGVIAAYWDVLNAEDASALLAAWIGPGGRPLMARSIVASSGEYQPLTYHGVTLRLTAANLAVRRAGTGNGRVATLNVAVCLAHVPGHATVVGKPPTVSDWRLVFPDGRRVAPVRAQPPGDAGAPPYPPAPKGAFDAVGDCAAGLVTFGIPAAEHGDPRTIMFASPKIPTVLAWSPPRDPSERINILGTAQPIAAGDPPGWTAVTGYSVHTAGPNREHVPPTDRIATLTVVTCASGTPTTIAAARRGWKLLLADGLALSPVRSRPADRGPVPYPDGRERIGAHARCRSGSIPFDIPAADTSDAITINYDTPHAHALWAVIPPAP